MHPAILGIALGTQLVTQLSDHVPKLNMERTCKARIADDRILGFQQHQPYEDCISAEKSAQQQLRPIWTSYSAAVHAKCTSDTKELGANSYLDLLFCLEMVDETKSSSSTNSKGSAKKKSPN